MGVDVSAEWAEQVNHLVVELAADVERLRAGLADVERRLAELERRADAEALVHGRLVGRLEAVGARVDRVERKAGAGAGEGG
jgi:hypothetical protein